MNIYQNHMQDCMANVFNVKLNGRRLRNANFHLDISSITAAIAKQESNTIELLLANVNGSIVEFEFLCDEGFELFLENLHKYWSVK